MTKRMTIAVLSAAALCAALGAEGKKDAPANSGGAPAIMNMTGYPIVKQPVTLKMVAQKRPINSEFSTMPFFKMMEEKTGVTIEWNLIPNTQYQEKKNLLLASGDLPDAFFGQPSLNVTDIVTYGPQGLLIDHTDLIAKYAPNIQKEFAAHPIMKSAATAPDGKIYAIPTVDGVGVGDFPDNLFIYKPWLEKLGLKAPETIDEFYATLKAFKEKDPNGNGKADEIPFTHIAFVNNQHIGSLFGAFGLVDNNLNLVVIDDKVIFTPLRDEWKQAVAYYSKYYAEGLFDPESFTQDQKQWVAKGRANPQIVGATMSWNNFDLPGGTNESAKDWITVGPLLGPAKVKLWQKQNTSNGGVMFAGYSITKACKMPEIAMRYGDTYYNKEIGAQARQGPIGINLIKKPDGKLDFAPVPVGKSADEFRFANAPGDAPFAVWPEDWTVSFPPRPIQAQKKYADIQKYYAPYAMNSMPGIMWTQEETKFMQSKGTDIQNYVREQLARWLLAGGIDAQYDNFVKTLKNMGVEEYIALQQKGYNRFIGKK